jgi:hypothetical protein
MARLVNTIEIAQNRPTGRMEPGWSLGSYPHVDETRVDHRPKVVATERMLWRRDHSLACPEGDEYAEEDLPLLMTESEFHALNVVTKARRPRSRK